LCRSWPWRYSGWPGRKTGTLGASLLFWGSTMF
jgi:hypothetical protein